MSKFYRNRKGFFATLSEGGGLWVAVVATALTVLCLIVILSSPGGEDSEVLLPLPTDTGTVSSVVSVTDPVTDVPTDLSSSDDLSTDVAVEDVAMILPVSGEMGSGFSLTVPVFSQTMNDWRVHQGIDILTNGAVDVFAAADGVVDQIYTDEMLGRTVEILHADGTLSLYQSLSEEVDVMIGQEVLQGDRIGKTGLTADCESLEGYHLHFALIRSGVYLDPGDRINP